MIGWCVAWHQVPAGSLPDDDRLLARLIGFGRDVAGWQAVREEALRGFVLCDDGRLYHPVVCEKALEAWNKKAGFRARAKAGASKRWGTSNASSTPQAQHKHSGDNASAVLKNAKGQGQGQGEKKKDAAVAGPSGPCLFDDPPSPEKSLFDFGKEVLGLKAGGLVKKLMEHFGGDIGRATDILRLAKTKSSPKEYVGAVLRGDTSAKADYVIAETDKFYRELGVL